MANIKPEDSDNSLWQGYSLQASAPNSSHNSTYNANYQSAQLSIPYHEQPQKGSYHSLDIPTLQTMPPHQDENAYLDTLPLTLNTHHSYPSLERVFQGINEMAYMENVQDFRDEFPKTSNPATNQDHRLLNFGMLPDKHTIINNQGQAKQIKLTAQMDGMFFPSELATLSEESLPAQPELTCYRRNLFQISGNISTPQGPLLLISERGERIPIISLDVCITATESIDGHIVKLITLPWKTLAPHSPKVALGQEPSPIRLIAFDKGADANSEFTEFPIAYRRLQFKTATAKNRRRELRQHFTLHLNVVGTLANGAKVNVCESSTVPIIVRGRSARNFQTRKEIPLNQKYHPLSSQSGGPQGSGQCNAHNDSYKPKMHETEPMANLGTPSPEINPLSLDHWSRPESPASSDLSVVFEADSAHSGDDTDWDQDSNPTELDTVKILDFMKEELHPEAQADRKLLIGPVLTPIKQALVNRIMSEFWIIFDQQWSENIRKCVGTPSTQSSASPVRDISSSSSSRNGQKRPARDDDDHSAGEDNENPKRPRWLNPTSETGQEPVRFACPYRKHDPRKYNHSVRNWRSCAQVSFESVARVKAHLYRHHTIYQCGRCGDMFRDEDESKRHFMALNPCQLKHHTPAEGITSNLASQLRSRKNLRSQSQEDRWIGIYRILFPTEAVPSPYFEPIQDERAKSPNSAEFSRYEEYARQELPRVFQIALEAAVQEEAQPIEERLRHQLVSMIQDCQNRVLATYRSRHASGAVPSMPIGNCTHSALPSDSLSVPFTGQPNANSCAEESAMGTVQNLFQELPYQSNSHSVPELMCLDRSGASDAARQNRLWDSGYFSHPSSRSDSISRNPESLATDTGAHAGSHAGSHLFPQSPTRDLSMDISRPFDEFENFISMEDPTFLSGSSVDDIVSSNPLNSYSRDKDGVFNGEDLFP